MTGESRQSPPGELRRLLQEQAGLDVVAVEAAGAGESRSAFWVTDRAGTVSVLKIMPDARPEAVGYLRELDAVMARLRDRGYPAPRFGVIGQVPGLVFWIQPRLPGAVLDRGLPGPDCAALGHLLPGLLRLNDAQAGLGTGPRQWRNLITQTLVSGGDGYCLHSTLQASSEARDLLPVLRRIGERCGPAIGDGQDFVHYDFTPANLLWDGTTITGVIDIQPPVLAGDRAFDLATLLFCHYDCEQIRELLRARLLALAGPEAASAYLAHMVLRQTDWSLRHHPAAAATRRHLNLARAVTADITDTLPH
ncbi:MAG: aminoglycoside phosphotransferase family protein [Streptosporangiaceae bacterium]